MPSFVTVRACLYALALLAVLLGVQTVRLSFAQALGSKYKAQSDKANAELQHLADESARLKAETAKVVKEAEKRTVIVEREAKRIEAAPLPGNCKTPDAIMKATEL